MASSYDTSTFINTISDGNSSIWDSIWDSLKEPIYEYVYDDAMHSVYDLFNQRLEYWMHIAVVVMCVEITIGLFGNILSLIVWNKGKKSSKMACSTYFKILAASDILTLLSFLIILVIPYFHDISQTNYCSVFGYTAGFLIPLAPQLSAWIIVCITIERVLSLCFPFRFSLQGFRRRAWFSFIGITVLLLVLNYDQYLCSSFAPENIFGFSMCTCVHSHTDGILGKVSMVWFLCILPVVLMTLGNVVIATRLFIMRRSKLHHSSSRQNRKQTFTKLCLSATCLHCISVLPVTIIAYYSDGLMNGYNIENLYEVYGVINSIAALLSMALALFILNNSLNFLIYCFTGTKFRSDLKELLFKGICKLDTGISQRRPRSST